MDMDRHNIMMPHGHRHSTGSGTSSGSTSTTKVSLECSLYNAQIDIDPVRPMMLIFMEADHGIVSHYLFTFLPSCIFTKTFAVRHQHKLIHAAASERRHQPQLVHHGSSSSYTVASFHGSIDSDLPCSFRLHP